MVAKVVVKYVPTVKNISLSMAISNALQEAILENPGSTVSRIQLIPKPDNTHMLLVGFDFAGGGGSPSVPGSNIGPYTGTTAYAVGDIVNYEGLLYTCIQDGTGQQPDISPLYWEAYGGNVVVESRAPLATDDTYPLGTIWVHEGVTAYVCILAATGAAVWVAVGSGSGGVNGGIFITDIVPQTTGNVGDKVFSSNGTVLDSCTTDTQLVTVSVMAVTGNSNFIPIANINGNIIVFTDESEAPLFRGTINIDLALATELTVVHEDGASHTVSITQESQPVVFTGIFTGGYPGTQTELKENDTYDFQITADSDIISVEFANYGAFKAQSFAVPPSSIFTVSDVVIADRGTTVQSLGARFRVQKSTGSWSDWYTTSGAVDGVNVVKLNNVYPSIGFTTVTYPIGQAAIKGSESATVVHTITDFNTVLYSNPLGEISIANTSTYEPNKSVTRVAGTYNVTNNNFRITAIRTANAATSVGNTVVYIAAVAPIINITIDGAPARLRSGGNDGTAAQNYTVRITSNQNLYAAPTLTAPEGTWQGGGFAGSGAVWTRTLQIHDNDAKGAYNFASLSAIGLAGVEQTTISSGAGYELGGFVSRTVQLEAFAYEVDINTEVVTYSKVTFSWDFSSTVNVREPLNSSRTITGGWCLVAIGYGITPVTIRILDELTDSSTQESYVTIEETI